MAMSPLLSLDPMYGHVISVNSVTIDTTVITLTTAIIADTVTSNTTDTTLQDDMIRAMAMEQKQKMQQKGNSSVLYNWHETQTKTTFPQTFQVFSGILCL